MALALIAYGDYTEQISEDQTVTLDKVRVYQPGLVQIASIAEEILLRKFNEEGVDSFLYLYTDLLYLRYGENFSFKDVTSIRSWLSLCEGLTIRLIKI